MTNLFNHTHGKLGVCIRELNANMIMIIDSTTPNDSAYHLERRFLHWNPDLDDATPLKSVRRLKAQPAEADVLETTALAGFAVRDMALDRNIGGVANKMSHIKNPLFAKIAKG